MAFALGKVLVTVGGVVSGGFGCGVASGIACQSGAFAYPPLVTCTGVVDPCASMVQISKAAKAILEPSGDQAGYSGLLPLLASARSVCPDPSAFIVKMVGVPVRMLKKAILERSGDQSG